GAVTLAGSNTIGGCGPSGPPEEGAPRITIQLVADTLSALLPTGNKKTDKRIQAAIQHIDASLDSSLWVDDSHLTEKGAKSFDQVREAVRELMRIKNPPMVILDAIQSLLDADTVL